MSRHWANDYIGIPYKRFGNDTDGFDCWGLVRHVLKHHYDISVPIIQVDGRNLKSVINEMNHSDELNNWREISRPKDGSPVLLSNSKEPHHVGIWLEVDGGGLLHSIEDIGVIFSNRRSLSISGWGNFKYYEHLIQFKSV